jgi:hypothetical protein
MLLRVCPSQFTLGNGMEEVIGSIPIRSTKSALSVLCPHFSFPCSHQALTSMQQGIFPAWFHSYGKPLPACAKAMLRRSIFGLDKSDWANVTFSSLFKQYVHKHFKAAGQLELSGLKAASSSR